MPFKSLESLFRSERRSYQFLVNEAWRQNRRSCVRCGSARIYRLADKRYRCAGCGYTFHDFTRRWVGELNLTARQWLWIVKLFELEIPPSQMAKEVGISYPTALKATYLIRRAIAEANGTSDLALNEDARSGEANRRGAANRRGFGLRERNRRISIDVLDVDVQEVLQEQPRFTKQGPIILTGPYRGYDGVILWRVRLPSQSAKLVPKGKAMLGGLDNFWTFARPRLSRFHRSSAEDLFYFLKELAFRYERRDQELFATVVNLMTRLMPH
jgi:transposase